MEILTVDTFKAKIFNYDADPNWHYSGDLPAIVDFYADWCGPCKMQAPILDEVAREYAGKIHVYKVDAEASPELAALFRIRSIPSLLFIPKGEKPVMAAGFMPKTSVEQAIRDVLKL